MLPTTPHHLTEKTKIALSAASWFSILGAVLYFGISLGEKYSDIQHEQRDLRKLVTLVIVEPKTLALNTTDLQQLKNDVKTELWQSIVLQMQSGSVKVECPRFTVAGLSFKSCDVRGFK